MLKQTENPNANNPNAELYELLGVTPEATEQEIRTAYISLCRIWRPAFKFESVDWSSLTSEMPNLTHCNIYKAIRFAFEILTNGSSAIKTLPSLQPETLAYKQQCEQIFKSAQQHETQTAVNLPNELWLYIASLVQDKSALSNLRIVDRRLYDIACEARWNDVIASHDIRVLSSYVDRHPFRFYPKTLDQTFQSALQNNDYQDNSRSGYVRLRKLRGYWNYSEKKGFWKFQKKLATRQDFQSDAAFHAYLCSNPVDGFFDQKALPPCQNDPALYAILTRKITTFEALILSGFTRNIATTLRRIVAQGSRLPQPFLTKADFPTTAAYFEYLIYNVHDLFLTLHNQPELINQHDEQGKTLLFYPVKAARFLPKERINWIMEILLNTPNIQVNLHDENGDTFLHITTRHCADEFHNHFGLASNTEHPIFEHVYVPFVEYADKRDFNFSHKNKFGFAVLHIAANQPCKYPHLNAIFPLIACQRPIDFNQLSGDQHTALAYAIARSRFNHANDLVGKSLFVQEASRQVLRLIFSELFYLSSELCSTNEVNAEHAELLLNAGTHVRFESIKKKPQIEKIRELQTLFNKIITLIPGAKLRSDTINSPVISEKMMISMIKKFDQQSYLALRNMTDDDKKLISKLRNFICDKGTIYLGEKAIIEFLQTHPRSKLQSIFYEVVREDLCHQIVNNYQYLDEHCSKKSVGITNFVLARQLTQPDSKPLDQPIAELSDYENGKQHLVVMLLRIQAHPTTQATSQLSNLFIQLIEDMTMQDCEALFQFLISHRANQKPPTHTNTIWHAARNNHINWSECIEFIRTSALKKAEATQATMSDKQAIDYLNACCSYSLFNLPNGWYESFSKTKAVAHLMQLKANREAEVKTPSLLQP